MTLKLFPFSDWRHVCIDSTFFPFNECNNLIWIKAEFSFVLLFAFFKTFDLTLFTSEKVQILTLYKSHIKNKEIILLSMLLVNLSFLKLQWKWKWIKNHFHFIPLIYPFEDKLLHIKQESGPLSWGYFELFHRYLNNDHRIEWNITRQ